MVRRGRGPSHDTAATDGATAKEGSKLSHGLTHDAKIKVTERTGSTVDLERPTRRPPRRPSYPRLFPANNIYNVGGGPRSTQAHALRYASGRLLYQAVWNTVSHRTRMSGRCHAGQRTGPNCTWAFDRPCRRAAWRLYALFPRCASPALYSRHMEKAIRYECNKCWSNK